MTLTEFYATEPSWLIGSIFILSLLIGSFLNVVIHRLPIMMQRDWRQQAQELMASRSEFIPTPTSDVGLKPDLQEKNAGQLPEKYNLVVPRSACPHCGTQITAVQNIPVISWLLLKGRCANCKAGIAARYPLIELSTAVLSAVIAWRFGFSWHMAAALTLTWTLIALCVIDFDHQLLPDDLTLPLMWTGLGLSLLQGTVLPVTPQDAIIGAMAGYLSLWLVFHLFKLATGKEGMGYGDFKLLAALGAWLGWQMLPLIIMLSACVGAVIGIGLILLRGRDRSIPIPFGPYLAAAGWIALLWGEQIVTAYLHTLQV
jgi:leader peptidase (prepilin peptidase)/N-methyltransferase